MPNKKTYKYKKSIVPMEGDHILGPDGFPYRVTRTFKWGTIEANPISMTKDGVGKVDRDIGLFFSEEEVRLRFREHPKDVEKTASQDAL